MKSGVMMKIRAVVILGICMAIGAMSLAELHDNLRDTLLTVSSATFTAFQRKDAAAMQALTSPTFVYVGKEGILTGEELAVATQQCTLRSFKLSAPRVRMLSPNSAVLVYKAQQDETCNGEQEATELLSSDTFVRKGGKWLVAVHTELAPSQIAR